MGEFSQIRGCLHLSALTAPDPGAGQCFRLHLPGLQDRNGLGHDALVAARNQLLGLASRSPALAGVRADGLEDATANS